jgi:hypothetical protein
MKIFQLILLFGLLPGSFGYAEVPDFLQRFEASPKEAALELPEKRGSQFPLKFSKTAVLNRQFVTSKDQGRLQFCEKAGQPGCESSFTSLALLDDSYLLKRFVGGVLETNILNLDKYKSGAAEVTPWSGSYWPQYEGGIGVRYGDPKFPHSETFWTNFKYYQKNYHKDAKKIAKLDVLSPAEKYDLLFEDKDWSLTYYSWAVPRRTYQMTGEVETWTGICHGWAAAAIVVPEPKKSFHMELPYLNRSMQVYPDDVKALASQAWAAAQLNSVFIGGRCDAKSPTTDGNGRIIEKNCFDTNPATWHLALLNWVGISKKSFVFDAVYDYEVWNQPIASYELRYFNPNTKQSTESLVEALIPYASFTKDPYSAYRSVKTKNIVGVELTLKYAVENNPRQVVGINDELPKLIEVKYYYDLEIDETNNVIGGEWYQLAHPDMMWRPTVARPLANNEPEGSYWHGQLPMANDLFSISKAASKLNQPLSAVLDQLIEWSKL